MPFFNLNVLWEVLFLIYIYWIEKKKLRMYELTYFERHREAKTILINMQKS